MPDAGIPLDLLNVYSVFHEYSVFCFSLACKFFGARTLGDFYICATVSFAVPWTWKIDVKYITNEMTYLLGRWTACLHCRETSVLYKWSQIRKPC